MVARMDGEWFPAYGHFMIGQRKLGRATPIKLRYCPTNGIYQVWKRYDFDRLPCNVSADNSGIAFFCYLTDKMIVLMRSPAPWAKGALPYVQPSNA